MTRLAFVSLVLAACAEPKENPQVVPEVTPRCGPAARLVTDACTKLGSDDGCVKVDDVCVALCDQRTSCTTVDDLRVIRPWAIAPGDYCVECEVP